MAGLAPSQLSLHEVLVVHEHPVSEEQAWALCYQGCRALQQEQQNLASNLLVNWKQPQFREVNDLTLGDDGTVVCVSTSTGNSDDLRRTCTEEQVVSSLGVVIYKALDWSLSEDEERVLSLPLEQLIKQMVLRTDNQPPGTITATLRLCESQLQDPLMAAAEYRAVCKALFDETVKLQSYLDCIRSAKALEKLLDREPSKDTSSEIVDWNRIWFQLMKEVRSGVRLRNICERRYNPLPIKFQLSPFDEMLDDIKYKRYILHKVNNNEPRTAADVSVDFSLLRSLLKPAAERKLRDLPVSTPSLHAMLMREIESAVKKLQPVSSEPAEGLVQAGISACEKPQSKHRERTPEFAYLEAKADLLASEQTCNANGQELPLSETAYRRPSRSMPPEEMSTKPISWTDATSLTWGSKDKYKFQIPTLMSKALCMGYEYVEIEEFHYASSLYIKELVCSCQIITKREVGNRRMVKDKFCFSCQMELFFVWALVCHFCKKINMFRVLYDDVKPRPCEHPPMNCKPLVVATVEAGVQAERCRCGWKKVQLWQSKWKVEIESDEAESLAGQRPRALSC
ncbi:protein spire homolog 1-like isoform X3 [Chiloscyllium plagiosum]|uniref:protein spire homolog 1-like isoform X3 n=1 Tax=Chiloscyllium plagiosum TaxID=36176 RepID=UPI001CB8504E|nr:protein spire homolog 1-like isoform X3 [Chiloscyllium plagiosum]